MGRERIKRYRFALVASLFLAGCSAGPLNNQKIGGPGQALAQISFAQGNDYSYGAQFIGATVDHTFTITNTGAATATKMSSSLVVSVFSFKGGTYPGVGGTCSSSLPAGASCTMVVTYSALYQSSLSELLTVSFFDGVSNQSINGPLLEGQAIYGASGTLDVTFNLTGLVTNPILGMDHGRGVVLQSNNRLVVAGYSYNGTNYVFSLARYNADGTLDTSFGSGGQAIVPVAGGDAFAHSVTQQGDGKIVVAGWLTSGSSSSFALARVNPDGSIDTSFGNGGIVTTVVGTGAAYAENVAMQADSKILAAGYTTGTSKHSFAIVRYNTDGTLDTTFGSAGILIPVIGNDDYAYAVTEDPEARIVVAGVTMTSPTNPDFAIARLTPTGSFDATFGTNGRVTTDIGLATTDQVWALALQKDGQILVAGSSSSGATKDFALVRYTTAGALDSSFAMSGRLVLPVGTGSAEANTLAIQTNGDIVLGGYTTSGSEEDFAAVRVTPTGTLDTTFATNGTGIYSFGPGAAVAYGMVLLPTGKVVMAGETSVGSGFDFAVARIWP